MLKLILIISCVATPLVSAAAVARNVPDGTLTYKIVVTGHGEQHHKPAKSAIHQGGGIVGGGGVTTENSETHIRWTIEVTEGLSGSTDAGRVTASGRLEGDETGDAGTVAAAAPAQGYTEKLLACHRDPSCLMHVGRSSPPQERQAMFHAGNEAENMMGELKVWGSLSALTSQGSCRAKADIEETQKYNGRFKQGGKSYSQRCNVDTKATFDCLTGLTGSSRQAANVAQGGAVITADPTTGYYIISFPAFTIKAKRTIRNDVYGGVQKQAVQVEVPAIDFKNLKLPTAGKPISGERRTAKRGDQLEICSQPLKGEISCVNSF